MKFWEDQVRKNSGETDQISEGVEAGRFACSGGSSRYPLRRMTRIKHAVKLCLGKAQRR